MNRGLLIASAGVPLLADASLKSAALVLLAAVCALLMRRASSAARHVVWLAAVLALLLVPVLSLVLPGWRVLPGWAAVEPVRGNAGNEGSFLSAPSLQARTPLPLRPALPQAPSSNPSPASNSSPVPSVAATVPIPADSPPPPPAPLAWLIPAWATGCGLLLMRLAAAHWLLRCASRRSRSATGHLSEAFTEALLESGVRQSVRLLVDAGRNIPVVWGVLRPCLLMPAEAESWDPAQTRSVLMHELAHLRRRDPLSQILTQIVCAVHWFNPLVWLAAWRLHVERERACDDLVLASGVRPSVYAGHLLHVATRLTPARWTGACGLAMARKSSLEGRLLAVLSEKLNRRGLTRALTVAAILLGAAIAIPVAMLRAQGEKPATPAASVKPKEYGATLQPDVERKLKWGEAVNGLRAALVIRTSPETGDTPDLYLLVQNVSEDSIHLNDTTAAEGLRYASIHRDDLLQSRTRIDEPTMTDIVLKSREAAFLLMISPGEGGSKGQLLAAGMLKEPHMILTGQMNIEKAPAGAWTGKLVTAPTGGADAQINQPAGQTGRGRPLEESLKWGEPVNGLRTAVAFFSTSSTKPKPDDVPELFLAIQNVSNAPLRLSDTGLGPKDPSRKLYLKLKGEIMMGLGSNNPALGDLTLQPHEIKTLLMFPPGPLKPRELSTGQLMTDGALKDTHQTFMMELKIEKAPAGAWTGAVRTADANADEAFGRPLPKDKKARALFDVWRHHARQSGEFPGGLIARLADKVNEFIRINTGDASGDPYAKKMAPIVPRLDATRDWKAWEVVNLMDDIAAVTSIPLQTTLEKTTQNAFTPGAPLPAELADAPWGEAQPNGLRMACLLEPRAAEQRLGTPLKARLLFHNSGKDNVVFRTQSWHQPGHKATDVNGADIKVDSTFWTTIGRPVTFRLEPGEFVEVNTPGIGVGPVGKHEDWQYTRIRVGSWVEAKAGDEVTITTVPLPIGSADEDPPKAGFVDSSAWWTGFIKYHLTQDLPIPADPEERRRLVYRAGMELFGTPLSTKEIDSFVNDREPSAIDSLANLLAQRTDTRPSAGTLTSGPTKFRVLPADPDAAKKPRTVSNPGQHQLGGYTTFAVTRRADGERIMNEAHLSHSPPEETKPAPHYKIELPDGYNSWAAGWIRDTTVLWITQKGLLRKYDFSDFSKIQETRYEGDKVDTAPIPPAIRDALRAELKAPDAPKPKRAVGGAPASTAPPAK